MKKMIALLTFALTTVTAHAAIVDFNSANQPGFVPTYSLNSFMIGNGSFTFPQASSISSGTVEFNHTTSELRLTLNRRFHCPPGAMCPMIMPAPVIVVLPVVYVGSGICGGTIVTAEKNDLPLDGQMLSIQIIDENGSLCEQQSTMSTNLHVAPKPVQVTITEQGSVHSLPIVSQMSGFPISM